MQRECFKTGVRVLLAVVFRFFRAIIVFTLAGC